MFSKHKDLARHASGHSGGANVYRR
jgi:hypothetical protein